MPAKQASAKAISEDGNLEQRFSNITEAGQKKQTVKRRQAEKDHDALVANARAELNKLDKDYEAALQELRRQHLNEFRQLCGEKAEIESEISQHLHTLQRAVSATFQEVKCAVEGRNADLGT